MNTQHDITFPDSATLTAELELDGTWNTAAVSELIRSKCEFGETPAFLFLGKKEASLLREHLARAFGAESVTTLRDTYYMGLEVVEIEVESFVYTGGRKAVRTLQDPIARRPAWRDRDTEAMWQLRI
ncbi:hypothetical protein OJ996_16525 [Luteolibacter sp. GHJ8]|jgi:hypothetical protein|uniref:Uncharacterized protein n=1 Tax=Luteolibacter rhizosphaerae TaxID=2989719 RepID=A0ABT3G6T1_9BACT|nr:hypothetical protein [Luteolibacter rhizosphaerae]MCW1915194.1 hypothetical protein [Luteolibacter rhizosphaerae]